MCPKNNARPINFCSHDIGLPVSRLCIAWRAITLSRRPVVTILDTDKKLCPTNSMVPFLTTGVYP